MYQRIINGIYPEKCPFCGKILEKKERGICKDCRKTLPYIQEPRCMKCGKPLRKEEEEYCYDCQKKTHFFEEGRSLWVHKPPVNQAVYAFKYQDLRCYGKVFAREMVLHMADYLERLPADALVPIPLHTKRYLDRGYNQAQILANALSKYTEIPVRNLLKRSKYTKPQKVLNDVERKRNIKGAFSLREEVRCKCVVLIDDIYTTGSTLDEAAKVLKSAGVQRVYFLTISIGQGI